MENQKKELGVFFLEKGRAVIYTKTSIGGVPIALQPDIVNDMEIVSEERLFLLIKRLLEANRIAVHTIVVVLSSDYTFINEIQNDSSEVMAEKLKSFQEIVPFENVETKIIKQEKKWKVVCVSRELCEKLRSIFEKMKIVVLGIAPYDVLVDSFPEFSKGFDPRIVMGKVVETIRLVGFTNQEEKGVSLQQEKAPVEKKNNLSLLLVVFGLLFVFLLIMIFVNRG